MDVKLSKAQVDAWRLTSHHLAQRALKKELPSVVSGVCGIQAQVLSAAELALRARVEGITRQDVRRALWEEFTIIKTWCMRGTLHLLSSWDLPIYVPALATKSMETLVWLEKTQGIKPKEAQEVTDAICDALKGQTLTRQEIAQRVAGRLRLGRASAAALHSEWGILLRPAAYKGELAFGPNKGANVTFYSPGDRIASGRRLQERAAFAELFRRFLRCYGPATLSDFAHWWGSLSDDTVTLLKSEQPDVVEVQVQGRRASMLRTDAEAASEMSPPHLVRLLPSFDCYAMFYSPREWFVPSAERSRVFRKTAGWNYPSVIVDGSAAGIWSLKKRGRRVQVNVELFRALGREEKRGVAEEADDIGRFLGVSTDVSYAPS